MTKDRGHKCDFVSLAIQFTIGGFVGLLGGFLLLFAPKYRILVEVPYSPFFVVACGGILAGLAMLYGDRLWSSDHIIPNRRPKHSRLSRLLCWLLVAVAVLLAAAMLVASKISATTDLEQDELFQPAASGDFKRIDSRGE